MERGRLPPGQQAVSLSAAPFHQPPHLRSEARSRPSSTVSQDYTQERSVHLMRLAALGEPYRQSRIKRGLDDGGGDASNSSPSRRKRSRITGDNSTNDAELDRDTASAGNTKRASRSSRKVRACNKCHQRRVGACPLYDLVFILRDFQH